MNLAKEISELTEDRTYLRQDMLSVRAMLKKQNKLMREILESRTQTVNTKRDEDFVAPVRFPLVDQQDLDEFEQSVTADNCEKLVNEARYLLAEQGLVKSLDKIMSRTLILDYNFEGKSGKRSLQDYKNFLEIIYKASNHDERNYSEFLDALRRALRYQKHRQFRKVSDQRKKERNRF